jgi:hypothetical protein
MEGQRVRGPPASDRKVQAYEPHGSVHPNHATSAKTFHITATETASTGTYNDLPNECEIPDPVTFAAAELARWIAAQVGAVLPEAAGVTVTATGSTVRVTDADSLTSVKVELPAFGEGEMLSALEAETAAGAVLATIQHVVIEALTVPWPTADASAYAVIRDGSLIAWYGAEDVRTLELGALAGRSR